MKKSEQVKRLSVSIIVLMVLVYAVGIGTPILLRSRISSGALHIPNDLRAGDTAQQDVFAEKTLYYIDQEATDSRIREAAEQVNKVFFFSQDITLSILNEFSVFSSLISRETIDPEEEILSKFSQTEILALREIDDSRRDLVLTLSEEYLKTILNRGIVSDAEYRLIGESEHIEIKGLYQGTDLNELSSVPKSSLIPAAAVDEFLDREIRKTGIPNELRKIISDIVTTFAAPNVYFDRQATERRVEAAKKSIQPVIKEIREGEILIKAGYTVTEEDIKQIRKIQEDQYAFSFSRTAAESLLILFVLSLFFYMLLLRIPEIFRKKQIISVTLGILLFYQIVLFFSSYAAFSYSSGTLVFYLPIAFFGMTLLILFSRFELSLYLTVIAAFLYSTVPERSMIDILVLLILGVSGSLLIRNARRRIDIIKGIGFLYLVYIVLLLFYTAMELAAVQQLPALIGITGMNVLLTGLVILVIVPIFEHVLNLPTVFRLMELMEHDNKVMKRMVQVARGTHSHSIAVAELSEAACEAIGADKLLAKVGAFYHDIGKIDQPEYFIENQTGSNKHDSIKPSLSAAVIKSHVKIGIEKAKEIGLPREVIEILAQHHGNDVISFFYSEALKHGNADSIAKEDYSYSGTPPLSKEAAVVMLADSVDAASRTLKQPSTAKIEKFIWSIIMKKIENKQLSSCDLSIKELEIIKEQFLVKLTGRFHKRISYPDIPQKKNDGSGKNTVKRKQK